MISDKIYAELEKTSPPVRKAIVIMVSLVSGIFAGGVLHYVLYRVELPSKPFIYVAF